jgi:flavin-dependent dehydrogenase
VSPNNGAGILPGIISARMLADYILDDSSGVHPNQPGGWVRSYEKELIRHFDFLNRETGIIRKLITDKRVGIMDLLCLYRNTKYFGMYPGMREIIRSLKLVGARFR